MTKKELNAIHASAYAEWSATADGKEFLASSHDHCRVWEISDVKCLFEINRKTKTLTPTSWR